jgi:hypothetical protein
VKGICFKEPLFHKVVAGEKTMTRRIMNPQPNMIEGYILEHSNQFKAYNWILKKLIGTNPDRYEVIQGFKSRYKVGEIVYLKEPYFVWEPEHCNSMPERFAYKYWDKFYKMKADIQEAIRKEEFELGYDTYYWHNKLFMPEKYARYFIKIKDIRVEKANQITEADAILEGCKDRAEFENWWIKIHGFSSWKENPYVFVYSFENIYEL